MLKLPLIKTPDPNFEEFKKVVKGEKKAEKVHFAELFPDPEIVSAVTEMLGEKSVFPLYSVPSGFEDLKAKKNYLKQWINFWYKMGYDYVTIIGTEISGLNFPRKSRKAEDTALIPRKNRDWVEEGKGIITSWKDFEKYSWPDPEKLDYSLYEFVSKNLPDGMAMMVCPSSGVFEITSEFLLGFEGLSYLLYDQPDLVEAVFNKVGDTLCRFYKNVVDIDKVGGFFQGDDMGFNTSTIVSPEILRRLVLPWHKKFAAIAHEHNKMYWLHCCGNVLSLMEDLIEDVKIDAFHSFQDTIIPVVQFKKSYGNRVGTLGGVDVDKLCRLDEVNLRKYVRGILDECMPYRYALGSGNSIANYVPVENYLIMLDEGLKWK